ncbi:MAG: hypothetical protein EXR12_09055 [Rhodospirillaceae bacterium]|nr:hypothetical protein [Rhodospirillaceae bacterium]
MSQHSSESGSSRFLSALGQMIHAHTPPRLNFLWVEGFAETLHLIVVDNADEPGAQDLRPENIARIGAAWCDFEADWWSGGFVLHLHDGRTMYVESYDDGEWGTDSWASAVPVAAGRDMPKLPHDHVSELYGWVSAPPELAEYLAHVKAVH